MKLKQIFNLADELVFTKTGKHLDDVQQTILEGTLQGKKYAQIATENQYSDSYIKEVACELWQILSDAIGKKVKKSNLKTTFERLYFYNKGSNLVSKVNLLSVNNMTQTATLGLTLEAFLQISETQPASEFINGKITQKAMPQGEHSRLQYKFCLTINQVAEPAKIACAFPELRCVFGGNAIVPDVAVFRWERIPRDNLGRIANRFEIYPDWSVEILSPDQQLTVVLEKLLYCSRHGTELGWLIDPNEEIVLVVFSEQRIQILREDESLPILPGIELELTVNQVFEWLTI